MLSPITLHYSHMQTKPTTSSLTLTLFEDPIWLPSVQSQLEILTALPQGWDAMGSPPVRADIGEFAINYLLPKIMNDITPAPSLVPVSGGGLQIEWHQNGMDIELFISGRFETEFYFSDLETGEVIEHELVADFSALEQFINRLN